MVYVNHKMAVCATLCFTPQGVTTKNRWCARRDLNRYIAYELINLKINVSDILAGHYP